MKNIFFLLLITILTSCNFADKYIGVNERFLEDEASVVPGYYTSINAAKADGVISYWDLDEGSGATSVDQAGGKNGTNNGSQIFSGKFYNSRYYNGTASVTYNNVATYNLFSGGQYTISFWVNIESIVLNTYFFDLASGAIGTPATPYLRFYISSAVIPYSFTIVHGATNSAYPYANMPNLINTWVHIAIVFNINTPGYTANKAILYINGISQGVVAGVYNSTVPTGTNARFASTGAGAGNIRASFDDIAIWNRALSAAQIFALYSCGGPVVKK